MIAQMSVQVTLALFTIIYFRITTLCDTKCVLSQSAIKKVFYPKNDLNVYDIISINLKFILSTNSSTRILISYSTFHRKAPNYFFSSIFNRDTIEITWRFALRFARRK